MESQPELPQDAPPETPREPIVTLPGALTAYVLLLAVVHLRVLLPKLFQRLLVTVSSNASNWQQHQGIIITRI